jgi:hypothetical protein
VTGLAVPDYVEPLVGWRVWQVVLTPRGERLGSVVYPSLWMPGVRLASSCLRARAPWRRSHDVPSRSCSCGIYATRDPGPAAEYFRRSPNKSGAIRVIGRVRLWGRVVEAAGGWRAAFAYPDALVLPHGSNDRFDPWEVVEQLSAYDVPVIAVRRSGDLEAALRSVA